LRKEVSEIFSSCKNNTNEKRKRKKEKKHCCINQITRPWLLTNANNRVQNTITQLPLLNAVCERSGEERTCRLHGAPQVHIQGHTRAATRRRRKMTTTRQCSSFTTVLFSTKAWRCLPNPKISNLLTSLSSEFMKQPKHSLTHSLTHSFVCLSVVVKVSLNVFLLLEDDKSKLFVQFSGL
jgi:hypothetical protein